MPNSFVNASNSRRLKFFSYSYFIFSPDVLSKKGCFSKRHLKSKGVISSALSALAKQYHKCNENTRRKTRYIFAWFVLYKIVAANLLHRILLFSTSDKMSHLQHFIKDFPFLHEFSDYMLCKKQIKPQIPAALRFCKVAGIFTSAILYSSKSCFFSS